jgi:hypothetical protein
MNYTILAIVFGLLNLLLIIVIRLYHTFITTTPIADRDEKIYNQTNTIKVLSDAFLGVVIGVFVLFGGVSLIGKLLNVLMEAVGLDKAITMEECFLINFVILFAIGGMIYLNDIHKDFFEQFKIARNNIKVNKNDASNTEK